MADKKTPREPCMICGHNPCDCGKPVSRKRATAERHKEVTRDLDGTPRTTG